MFVVKNVDPDAENISEDELPAVQVVKVPETEEVSDEELPGPKRAELPADTEVQQIVFFLILPFVILKIFCVLDCFRR